MNNESTSSGECERKHDELPPIGKSVVVEVNGRRCMAYRGQDGKWRDYFYGEELCGQVRLITSD